MDITTNGPILVFIPMSSSHPPVCVHQQRIGSFIGHQHGSVAAESLEEIDTTTNGRVPVLIPVLMSCHIPLPHLLLTGFSWNNEQLAYLVWVQW